jgi:hypothetical protein
MKSVIYTVGECRVSAMGAWSVRFPFTVIVNGERLWAKIDETRHTCYMMGCAYESKAARIVDRGNSGLLALSSVVGPGMS